MLLTPNPDLLLTVPTNCIPLLVRCSSPLTSNIKSKPEVFSLNCSINNTVTHQTRKPLRTALHTSHQTHISLQKLNVRVLFLQIVLTLLHRQHSHRMHLLLVPVDRHVVRLNRETHSRVNLHLRIKTIRLLLLLASVIAMVMTSSTDLVLRCSVVVLVVPRWLVVQA